MILLVAGASHTGKTAFAQKLLLKYGYPYLSLDHLKMGLIRSGYTTLTPLSHDSELTNYLWPIAKEMIKTAIENEQNLIVEGCYIPFDWTKDFEPNYLVHIQYRCLIMSKTYIKEHAQDIRRYANTIERRGDDTALTMESLTADNQEAFDMCKRYGLDYILIDSVYPVNMDFE